MRVALVYPPFADATQPYSSIAALSAFLRASGRHEPVPHDANLDYVLHMLTRERIASAAAHAEPESSVAMKAPIVCDAIEDAIGDLRSPATFTDLARLLRARRMVDDAWEILECEARLPSWSAGDVERFARDRDRNPFFSFFETQTLPALQRIAPGAVGISITYRRQIVPAVTLALLIKERMPGVPVIAGGQIVSVWQAVLGEVPRLFDWFDFLIAFEGESALDALLSALEEHTPLDDVPNLAHRDGVHRVHVEDIDALPCPDYRGFPLDRYLAPEPVLLLNTSRGCYWSKCAFCSVSPSMRGRYRMRDPGLVLEDLATLQARHDVRCISFGDDCVAPRMLAALSHGIRERGLEVSWQCEVRFESRLDEDLLSAMRASGCRNLIFGLESYAPRVLASMNKGVRHAEIRRILDDCRRHGLAFNLQLFFGFPGETREEARQSADFVAAELRGAATASFGTFRLQRGSGVALHPEAFGVAIGPDAHPLAIELTYEPEPAHADAARRDLHSRANAPRSSLGLDAHTILYLHYAGLPDYYAERVQHSRRLRRRPDQRIAGSILYDHQSDRAVELSPLGLWIAAELDARPRSPRELARSLAEATGEPVEAVLPVVEDVTNELLARGMLS